jgi:hypothetical protein
MRRVYPQSYQHPVDNLHSHRSPTLRHTIICLKIAGSQTAQIALGKWVVVRGAVAGRQRFGDIFVVQRLVE